jgi:hypothetical protein
MTAAVNTQERAYVNFSDHPLQTPVGGYAGKVGVIKIVDQSSPFKKKNEKDIQRRLDRSYYFTVLFENVRYKEVFENEDLSTVFNNVRSYLKHSMKNSGGAPVLADTENLFFDARTLEGIWSTYFNASQKNAPKQAMVTPALNWEEE